VKTEPYKLDPRIICDCCAELATRKGGDYPHYLCDTHAVLPEPEIERLMRAKYGMC
jgi:hypothetical protein